MLHRTITGPGAIAMAVSEVPNLASTKFVPEDGRHLLAGAASPLWLIFGGAAVAGASWWWWASRWREAVNVEALMAIAPEPVSPGVIDEPELEAEAVAAVEALAEPAALVEASVAPALEAAPEAVIESAEAVGRTVEETPVAAEPVIQAVIEMGAEAAVTVVETGADLVEAAADDLTVLVGIGPKLSASLADLGVTRFAQIAAWTDEELGTFDALLNLKGRAERDSWIDQAKRLSTSK